MATRNIIFSEGEFYHLYNRGTDKRIVYESPADYQRFLELLYLSNSKKAFNVRDIRLNHASVFEFKRSDLLVAIGAYCLMPNHFHLLLTPLVDGGVSIFMNKLATGYTMYFNKRNERTGALFGGMFKAKHADTDPYLKYLYAYIHLNPSKLFSLSESREAMIQNITNYRYSSLCDYVGNHRVESSILEPRHFPEYFKTSASHFSELNEWLAYDLTLP